MTRLKLKKQNGSDPLTMDQLKKRFVFYLEKGLTTKEACLLIGCNDKMLTKLRHDPEFEEIIQLAIAADKEYHLNNIRDAGMEDWKASAWYLERKYSEDFAKKDIVRHEYTMKIQILQKVFVEAINEELKDHPELKFKIINRLRNYEYNPEKEGKQLQLEHKSGVTHE